jgi:hypothetical protein
VPERHDAVPAKKAGGGPVTQIRFHTDDPEDLVAAAQAQLDACRAAPSPAAAAPRRRDHGR